MCTEGLELSVCDPLYLYNETWLPLSIILTDYALIKKKTHTLLNRGRRKRAEACEVRRVIYHPFWKALRFSSLPPCLFPYHYFLLSLSYSSFPFVCVTQLASLMEGCAEITEPRCSHASPQAARQRIRVHCFCLRPPPGQANLNLSNLRTSFAGEYTVTLFAAEHNSRALIIINQNRSRFQLCVCYAIYSTSGHLLCRTANLSSPTCFQHCFSMPRRGVWQHEFCFCSKITI